MGESKRNREIKKLIHAVEDDWISKGLYIKAGFMSFATVAFPNGMTPDQAEQLEQAFFGGAQHVFGLIASADDETEEQSMRKLSALHIELRDWIRIYVIKHGISL